MSEGKRISSEIMSMIIMGVLFLTMLMFVVFSASAYRSSVQVQKYNNDLRAALGYVATAVKGNTTDDIALQEINGVNTLVITDHVSGLEQRIYFKDGQIYENYGALGYEFRDDAATVIGNAEVFEMSIDADDLLRLHTDFGDSYVSIGK